MDEHRAVLHIDASGKMMESVGWGIVGPGKIAHRFAQAVQATEGARLSHVVGRNAQRVDAFVQHWKAAGPHVVGSSDLQALLSDPSVDAVYIATPHNAHFELARACLQAGKPVLCEKALCVNVAQTLELVRESRERGVFLMEALWTRYLPAYQRIGQWLSEGRIGRIQAIQSSFCFHVPYNTNTEASRIYNPALAGGCVLDIGVYNVSMTRWVMAQELARLGLEGKAEPEITHVSGSLAPNGVERHVQAQLRLSQLGVDIQAQFICGFDCDADNRLRIFGEQGYIETGEKFWQTRSATLHTTGQMPEIAEGAFEVNGFEYELREAMHCLRSGFVESARMTHAESLALCTHAVELRQRVGARSY